MRRKLVWTALSCCLVLCCTLLFATVAAADDKLPAGHLFIVSAEADLQTVPCGIQIFGNNFCATPVVTIGGAPVTVTSATATEINGTFDCLSPGDYALIVVCGDSNNATHSVSLTVGGAADPNQAELKAKMCDISKRTGAIPKPSWCANTLICAQANGLTWCWNPDGCGQPCNQVCAVDGRVPAPDATVSAAQDTVAECQAIATALGVTGTPSVASYTYACVEDTGGAHGSGVPTGLVGPLLCSSFAGCPANHRNSMDQVNINCGPTASRKSICACL